MRAITCRPVSLLTVTLLAGGLWAATGLRVFHIGNSLTDETYGVHGVAEHFGYTVERWGRHIIPGAPIYYLRECESDGFKEICTHAGNRSYGSSTAALSSEPWDVLVLQIFPQNGDGNNANTINAAADLASAAWQGNPNCRVYLYPGHTMQFNSAGETYWIAQIIEPVAAALTARFPSRKPVLVIPTFQAWERMWRDGYADLWWSAEDTHAGENGAYLLFVTFYATLYRANPSGAPASGLSWNPWWYTGADVTPSYIPKAQAVAWDIVRSYRLSGVGSTDLAAPGACVARGHALTVEPPKQAPVCDLRGRLRQGPQAARRLFVSGNPSCR